MAGRSCCAGRPSHEERGGLRRFASHGRQLGRLGVLTEVSLKVPARGMRPRPRCALPARRPRRWHALTPGVASRCRSMPAAGSRRAGRARCTCACAAPRRRCRPPAAPWAASGRTAQPPPTGRPAATSACPGSRSAPRARRCGACRCPIPPACWRCRRRGCAAGRVARRAALGAGAPAATGAACSGACHGGWCYAFQSCWR